MSVLCVVCERVCAVCWVLCVRESVLCVREKVSVLCVVRAQISQNVYLL